MSDLRLIRGASNSRFGGVHWFEWKPKDEVIVGPPAPDLLLLHPLPHDGAFFSDIAPYLAAGRTVIAADYPGYGKSDPPPGEATVEDWADAMLDTLAARSTHGAADLLGYREGCLVAAEMGLRGEAAVRRLVMVDVPFGSEPEREQAPTPPYPAGERFPRIGQECLVIASGGERREASLAARAALPHSRLVEFPELRESPLVSGAAAISGATLAFLAGETDQPR